MSDRVTDQIRHDLDSKHRKLVRDRLTAIHWSVWLFGVTQWIFDVLVLMAVLSR